MTLSRLFCLSMVSLGLLSSCIDEATSTEDFTQQQYDATPSASEASFWAIPSTVAFLGNDAPTDFGWGSVMHIRDVMTDDYTSPNSSYDHYTRWARLTSLGQEYAAADFTYHAYYRTIVASNIAIAGFERNHASLTDAEKGQLGAAYAFRAMAYLDAARMYEFLPNEKYPDGRNTEGNVITGLTIPIKTDSVNSDATFHLPRATHAEMLQFILSDLDKAEALTPQLKENTKDVPHLGVVYGLKARLYLWDGQYAQAAEYARKAIDEGYTPLSENEWLNTRSGFNDPNNDSWMMSASVNKETLTADKNLTNWSSWLATEGQFGYAGLGGVYPIIASGLYNKIADTDFRKLSFKAPEGHPLEGKTPYIDNEIGAQLPDYASVKFRPGQGELDNFQVAAACSYPLMRVEEMYLIEAEAQAHLNPAQGVALLNTFMQTYRDASYHAEATTVENAVDAVLLQKRIELWGEGQTFFDIKRLNLSVNRAYAGTNFPAATRFSTNGRPAWMNFVIPRTETLYNSSVTHYNNPDPSNSYTAVR